MINEECVVILIIFFLGPMIGLAFEYATDQIEWYNKQSESKNKQSFCDHKEEECVKAIPLPYSHYNIKCCLKCKKCGRERWVIWYFNDKISKETPIPAPHEIDHTEK